MARHDHPLRVRQARRLEQDRIRNAELADVVEERCVAEELQLGVRKPELAADREGELLHAP